MNKNTFPIDALPNIIKDAINEVHKNTQAPIPLIAVSALGVMSLACQNQINVLRYNNDSMPVSLFFLTLAESGERKSTVDKLFMKPIYQMEAELNQKYQTEMSAYRHDKKLFDLKKKSLSKLITTAYQKGNDLSDFEAQFKVLSNSEPKEPILYKFCFNDATPQAIKDHLSKGSNSIGLMSDEAGVVFEGRALNELGFINKMWDGSPFSVSRKSEEDQYIKDARMTLSLMVQPTIFKEFIQKKGDKAKDIGFFARCLISQPASTQGYRIITDTTSYSEYLTKFHHRLTEILSLTTIQNRNRINIRYNLSLSDEAKAHWINTYNDIEKNLMESGTLYHHKEFGSKMAEHWLRLAAIIHYFSYDKKLISLDSLQSAGKLVHWFYLEQLKLFPANDEISVANRDADTLSVWLNNFFDKNNIKEINKNYIRQYGPNSLRDSKRLDKSLAILASRFEFLSKKKNKTTYIYRFDLNDLLQVKDGPSEYIPMMEAIGSQNYLNQDFTVKR